MAARFRTKTYTFPSATPVTVATILALTNDIYFTSLTLRAAAGNAGNVTWLDTVGGTDGGYLDAGEAVAFDLNTAYLATSDILLSAPQNDVVYITVMS